MYKETLSKDLSKLAAVEYATQALSRRFSRIGWALLCASVVAGVAMPLVSVYLGFFSAAALAG